MSKTLMTATLLLAGLALGAVDLAKTQIEKLNQNAQPEIQPKISAATVKELMSDDFEKPAPRAPAPNIALKNIGVGLMLNSNLAQYSAAKGSALDIPLVKDVELPKTDKLFLRSSFSFFGFPDHVGTAALYFQEGGKCFALKIEEKDNLYLLHLSERMTNGSQQKTLFAGDASTEKLPIQFDLYARCGNSYSESYYLGISTPVAIRCGQLRGKSPVLNSMRKVNSGIKLEAPAGQTAELELDNLQTSLFRVSGLAASARKLTNSDKKWDISKEKGWTLVFADEFDGTELDTSRWIPANIPVNYAGAGWPKVFQDPANIKPDGKGLLAVRATVDRKKNEMRMGSMSTHQMFRYGYFEARLRFSKQPGWFVAFWLYGGKYGGYNPLVNGFEIDIMEDYYLKIKNKDQLHHNVHVGCPFAFKTWTSFSQIPDCDRFYTLGVKWTPAEIVYYLDGEEVMSLPSECHVFGNQPLTLTVNSAPGSIGSIGWIGDHKDGVFPDELLMDYVRVYQQLDYAKQAPQVELVSKELKRGLQFDCAGKKYHFSIKAEPSAAMGKRVQKVFLLDNGYVVESKTTPPYDFEVELSPEFYASTPYMAPGDRPNQIPQFYGEHAFGASAADENGNVGMDMGVAPLVYVRQAGECKPFGGTPQSIPGRVNPSCYDEGGPFVSYYDTTSGNNRAKSNFRTNEAVDTCGKTLDMGPNEWLRITVDIKNAGKYQLKVAHIWPAFESQKDRLVDFFLDDKLLTQLNLKEASPDWSGPVKFTSSEPFELPAGKHMLLMQATGSNFNCPYLEFQKL